jgi:hypothetical protein
MKKIKQALIPFLTLFTSLSTLICCALPALLVTLGLGASLAGLISAAPWLTVISDHKEVVFGMAGIMLTLGVYVQWKGRNAPCPIDPDQARACTKMRRANKIILGISVLIYGTGFFFAFIAAKLL